MRWPASSAGKLTCRSATGSARSAHRAPCSTPTRRVQPTSRSAPSRACSSNALAGESPPASGNAIADRSRAGRTHRPPTPSTMIPISIDNLGSRIRKDHRSSDRAVGVERKSAAPGCLPLAVRYSDNVRFRSRRTAALSGASGVVPIGRRRRTALLVCGRPGCSTHRPGRGSRARMSVRSPRAATAVRPAAIIEAPSPLPLRTMCHCSGHGDRCWRCAARSPHDARQVDREASVAQIGDSPLSTERRRVGDRDLLVSARRASSSRASPRRPSGWGPAASQRQCSRYKLSGRWTWAALSRASRTLSGAARLTRPVGCASSTTHSCACTTGGEVATGEQLRSYTKGSQRPA